MGFIILIILVIVLLIYTLFSKRKKRALLISLGIIVGYILYTNHACGPDSGDVNVMKPMAQAISEYIVKHGIPKSLKDIPDLPYELEGCKRVEYYMNFKSYDHVPKEKAKVLEMEEVCHFKNIKLEFGISKYLERPRIGGVLYMFSTNKTVLNVHLSAKDGKNFSFRKIDIGSGKSDGICNPMRQ